jgi:pimeloyl-ACP methyl ester carboxylesterase
MNNACGLQKSFSQGIETCTTGCYAYLKRIAQPTLVVNGSNDVIIYTVNSYILQQHLPNAQLILYPDSNHGSQYQYPELFVGHVTQFLQG